MRRGRMLNCLMLNFKEHRGYIHIGLNGLNGLNESFFGEFLKTTDDAKDTKTFGTGKRSVKSAQKWMLKGKENNKSAFYLKINGFLFGNYKNNS